MKEWRREDTFNEKADGLYSHFLKVEILIDVDGALVVFFINLC